MEFEAKVIGHRNVPDDRRLIDNGVRADRIDPVRLGQFAGCMSARRAAPKRFG
jgi:hypothetical protein